MDVSLVVIFGAVVGLVCFSIYGSGYGLWWDTSLGIIGFTIASCVMTAAYLMNGFGKADVIGFNWYCMAVGSFGALLMIYGTRLYKRANTI